jgi:pectate lyase
MIRASILLVSLAVSGGVAAAGPAVPPGPLPPPGGTVVNVATVAQLQNAVAALASNTTIVMAPGTYSLGTTLYINGTFTNVGIRGATGNRDDVVLVGKGMSAASDGGVPFGIWVGGDVRGVTIASLTIRDVYYHAIMLNAGAQSPLIHNVRLVNAGEQFIKANPDGAGGGVDNGIVEYSVIEYDTTSRDAYTNGVDVHTGDNWIIRHNLFRNVRAPQGQLAGPAILMWNASTNTLVDGNTFINCQREIALGLIERTPNDHTGGIVRNNFIYRDVPGDSAVYVADSPGTQVLHNTILISRTYANPIEYRFPHTTGVVIANNVLDGNVMARDGATGSVSGNYTNASAALFVNPAAGDLHLRPTATVLLGQVSVPPPAAGVDWDGESRPAGSTDTGADEYSVGTSTPPIPPTNLRIVKS